MVALRSPDDVAALGPDLPALAEAEVAATCFAGSGAAWKMRMFAPADGISEDPATGSAAGPLACHLCRHGLVEWGEWIEISQGAEIGRPSTLFARADGSDASIERVLCGGRAVVVARGEFRL
jgi:trans-2,3-dihydro-3-hydroxyanthranilate isomerase